MNTRIHLALGAGVLALILSLGAAHAAGVDPSGGVDWTLAHWCRNSRGPDRQCAQGCQLRKGRRGADLRPDRDTRAFRG